MQSSMILVCHAADGHFADGDRDGVYRVLDRLACVVKPLGRGWYEIACADGGTLRVHAPGLDRPRTFHRMELILDSESWTADVLNLILELMRAGGFGLMDSVDTSRFLVTSPQQIIYFPWLPEPPHLVRNLHDLGRTIGHAVL